MALDVADIQALEALFDRKIQQCLERLASMPPAAPIPRLTVEQFARATELHVETVRFKIRVGAIPAEMVFGERPKRISPRALELFGVTPQEARSRLEARNLAPAPPQSAA